MDFTVSAKDKKLLYVVSLLAFAVLYLRFMLFPGLEAYRTAKADLADAENARAEMQQTLMLAPTYAANKDAAWGLLQQANGSYYPLLSSGELDTLVTGLELQHNLEPVSLDIGTPAAQSLAGYTASTLAGHTAGLTDSSTLLPTQNLLLSNFAASAVTPEISNDYLRAVSVRFTCTGSSSDFLSLLDTLARDYPAIHIDSFSMSGLSYATAEGEAVENSSFDASLSIFLCDKGGVQP